MGDVDTEFDDGAIDYEDEENSPSPEDLRATTEALLAATETLRLCINEGKGVLKALQRMDELLAHRFVKVIQRNEAAAAGIGREPKENRQPRGIFREIISVAKEALSASLTEPEVVKLCLKVLQACYYSITIINFPYELYVQVIDAHPVNEALLDICLNGLTFFTGGLHPALDTQRLRDHLLRILRVFPDHAPYATAIQHRFADLITNSLREHGQSLMRDAIPEYVECSTLFLRKAAFDPYITPMHRSAALMTIINVGKRLPPLLAQTDSHCGVSELAVLLGHASLTGYLKDNWLFLRSMQHGVARLVNLGPTIKHACISDPTLVASLVASLSRERVGPGRGESNITSGAHLLRALFDDEIAVDDPR